MSLGKDKLKSVFILGHNGKLGSMICKEMEISGIDYGVINRKFDMKDITSKSIIIDVSSVEGTNILLFKLLELNIFPTVIIGTTGFLPEDQIKKYQEYGKIIKVPNFSIGCNFIFRMLGSLDKDYWISSEITDFHHVNKKDSPSGTALKLSEKIKKATGLNSIIMSHRTGDIVGTHIIELKGIFETITIKHDVSDRRVFAIGCVNIVNSLLDE